MQRLKLVCQPEPDSFGGNRLNFGGKRKCTTAYGLGVGQAFEGADTT